jgi:serine/threonine protein kinase
LIKGSANYIAPEVVKGKEVGFEVDWWALGIMAYVIVNRDLPFFGSTIQEVMDSIIKGEIDWSNVGKI